MSCVPQTASLPPILNNISSKSQFCNTTCVHSNAICHNHLACALCKYRQNVMAFKQPHVLKQNSIRNLHLAQIIPLTNNSRHRHIASSFLRCRGPKTTFYKVPLSSHTCTIVGPSRLLKKRSPVSSSFLNLDTQSIIVLLHR